jgi:hypothetical protein
MLDFLKPIARAKQKANNSKIREAINSREANNSREETTAGRQQQQISQQLQGG